MWVYFTLVNSRHSRVKTQGMSCIGDFGQTDGQRKFELGIPKCSGASYIRGAPYIRRQDGNINIGGILDQSEARKQQKFSGA